FELLHGVDLVLDANLVEPLDHVRLNTDTHVLSALHQERLIDQVAQRVLLAFVNGGFELFRSALALALLASIVFGCKTSAVIFRTSNDFIVYARDDLFNGSSALQIACRFRFGSDKSGLLGRLGLLLVSGSHPGLLEDWRLLLGILLGRRVLSQERHSRKKSGA